MSSNNNKNNNSSIPSSWWSSNGKSDLSWWNEGEDEEEQATAFGKSEENERDCSIYVIDCNESMFEMDDEKSNSFERCCKAIVNAFKRKIIQSRDDLVGILLYNTRESENPMKHKHVYLLTEPSVPSAKLIKRVRDLPLDVKDEVGSLNNNTQCDFRELLWTLQNIYSTVDVQGSRFGSKRALIFTMNDNPYRKDNNATLAKAADMLDAGIEISVFPLLKIKDEKPNIGGNNNNQNKNNKNKFNIGQFYSHVCSMDLDEFTSAQALLDSCATLEDLEDGLRTKEMKKRSLISCPFTLGGDNHIAVKIYCLYRRASKEAPKWLDARTNQPLTTETRWICKDTGTILNSTDIKYYHEYSSEKLKIPFTKEEMKELKTFGTPSLVLMGFKPIERLKDWQNFRSSYFMYPNEARIEGSTLLFNTLLTTMIKLKKIAIARFIFRKVGVPRFVALLPQSEIIDLQSGEQEQAPGIHIIFLPYADDIRKPEITQYSRANQEENEELITKAKGIIDKLTLKGLIEPANPQLQKHYDALEAIALEEDIDGARDGDDDDDVVVDEEAVDYDDEITPDDEAMLRLAGDLIQDFKATLGISGNGGGAAAAAAPKKRGGAGAGGAAAKRGGKRGAVKAMEDGDNDGMEDKKPKKKAASKKKGNNDNDNNDNGGDLDWKKLAENDELGSLKVADLKTYCGNHKLKKSGKKADLIQRIKDHLGVSD